MTALSDWLDSLPQMLTTTAAGNLRTFRRVGGSNGTVPDRPRLIVIHTMETPEDNRAQSTARWVQSGGGTAKVSCHFCVDNDEAIRCVIDEHVAFTQLTPWNDMSLSIEQSGRAASTADEWKDAYSIGQRALVAKIVAAWSEKWGIPLRFIGVDELVDWKNCTGVTTHYQLSLASQRPELTSLGYKPGNHWDPGPNYPMDQLLAEAAAHLSAPPVVDPSPSTEDTVPKRVTFGGQAAIFIGDYDPASAKVTTVRWLSPEQSAFYANTGDVVDLPWDHVQHVACLGPVPNFGVWPFARVVDAGSTDLDAVAADMARRISNG